MDCVHPCCVYSQESEFSTYRIAGVRARELFSWSVLVRLTLQHWRCSLAGSRGGDLTASPQILAENISQNNAMNEGPAHAFFGKLGGNEDVTCDI